MRVWYLEMREPPAAPPPPPPAGDYRIRRIATPDLEEYRRLYLEVGEPWRWTARRRLDDARLAELLSHPCHELWQVQADGRPVGFAELDRRRPDDVELVYFGLVASAIGTGAGPWFLRAIMDEMWRREETRRFWLHTCEHDHPRALAFYQRLGLELYDERMEAGPYPKHQLVW
ncbi:MAG: GNAT family N-acetyltransferase [Thermoanaerobaculia bacterium]|nr:GNAT family N-acetyltransferase [Thermoanaerobaculia bacterium]